LERQDLSRTYLAHHELERVIIITVINNIIIIIIVIIIIIIIIIIMLDMNDDSVQGSSHLRIIDIIRP